MPNQADDTAQADNAIHDVHDVTVFKAYDFQIGEKIRIEGGKRSGDWMVIGCSGNTVTLQCPVSKREFEWPIFCYQTDKEQGVAWPKKD